MIRFYTLIVFAGYDSLKKNWRELRKSMTNLLWMCVILLRDLKWRFNTSENSVKKGEN
jgi:hypothetical protein